MEIKPLTYIRNENSLFFEFETSELVEVEHAGSIHLFRLEIHPKQPPMILVASDDDYYVYDDVTHMFDGSDVLIKCLEGLLREELDDMTEPYKEFLVTAE